MMSFCFRFFVLLSCCVPSVLGAMRCSAQAAPTEPAGYRPAVEEAKKEYDRGNYAEARALFAKANGMYPNARALRGQGMAEFELRNYGDCIANLEKALASNVKPLDGQLRTETVRLLERARSFVARLSVAVEPSVAMVVVDGVPIPIGPSGNLLLEPGAHLIEFRAEGYAPEKRLVKVIGGEEDSMRVVLPKAQSEASAAQPAIVPTAQPSAPTPADVEPKGRKPLYKNPWLWTGVGVATAAIVTGLIIGLSGGGGTREPSVPGAVATAKLP